MKKNLRYAQLKCWALPQAEILPGMVQAAGPPVMPVAEVRPAAHRIAPPVEVTIRGKVTGNNRVSLPAVLVQGTTNATMTSSRQKEKSGRRPLLSW